jgi:hypothetical protein
MEMPIKKINIQELEEKRYELEEKYNFNLDRNYKCYSFVLDKKKAFIINLSDKYFYDKITPFIMHRGKLGLVVDKMVEETDTPNTIHEFVNICMGIIGNMLDSRKMGSIESFINHIWEVAKSKEEFNDSIHVYSDIITMIDYAVEKQLSHLSQEELEKIHNKFIEGKMHGGFRLVAIKPDGSIENILTPDKDDPEPEKKYDLENMIPLNTKEI